ncbi:unnamed protein product [Prorocentrum cordatum]|uniref:Uncharacterized protein n=1 Tax=Prorocentrum cordatum TaxID=2364126 RepID=A0ABN9QZT8_9DINO|nr:unnamed protein product [Polarella glacialis]
MRVAPDPTWPRLLLLLLIGFLLDLPHLAPGLTPGIFPQLAAEAIDMMIMMPVLERAAAAGDAHAYSECFASSVPAAWCRPRVFLLQFGIALYALLRMVVWKVSWIVLAESLELWFSLQSALMTGLNLLMAPWTSLIAILTALSTPQSLRIRGRYARGFPIVLLVMLMLMIRRYAPLLWIVLRTVFRIVLAASLELWIVLQLGRMPRAMSGPLAMLQTPQRTGQKPLMTLLFLRRLLRLRLVCLGRRIETVLYWRKKATPHSPLVQDYRLRACELRRLVDEAVVRVQCPAVPWRSLFVRFEPMTAKVWWGCFRRPADLRRVTQDTRTCRWSSAAPVSFAALLATLGVLDLISHRLYKQAIEKASEYCQ